MPLKNLLSKISSPLITSAAGILNTGIEYLINRENIQNEKDWWYEQQKFIEEHNSPAYQAVKLRQAGLNPYTEIGSVPLGNVDSSLPRVGDVSAFDPQAIQNSLLTSSQIEKNESDAKKSDADAALLGEKLKTESEWRNNIIQQTLLLEQQHDLGLITKEQRDLELAQYKEALAKGYNFYTIDYRLKESNMKLNQSIESLNEVKEDTERAEQTKLTIQSCAESLKLALDLLYAPLERNIDYLQDIQDYYFTAEQIQEWLDLQDTRQSLFNVQIAFAKMNVDREVMTNSLLKVATEKDKAMLRQMLDAIKDGDGLRYYFLKVLEDNPGQVLSTFTNFATSYAPNFNISDVTRNNSK